MSTFEEHNSRLKHKKDLLYYLKQNEKHEVYSDWYVTMSFYAAVECIEAMFCEVKPVIKGRMGEVTVVEHCRNHKERNATLRHCYGDLFPTYTTLYGQNRIAKYRCYVPVPNNGQNAESLLSGIENECNRLIKEAESKKRSVA